MDSDSPRADVEARLQETAEAMSNRLSSLGEEISTTRTSLRDWVARNPWKSVGGMLAAGVTVGMLFGGGGKKQTHHELLEQYIEALRAEVDEAVRDGESPGQALEKALRDRAPLVVYEQADDGGSPADHGFLRKGVRYAFLTAFREAGKNILLSLLDSADVEGMVGGEHSE